MGHSHGTKWDDNMASQRIKDVMYELGIDRMPTNTEIQKAKSGCGLTSYISRNGGYAFWANKLNLKTKDSETKDGWRYQDICYNILISKGYRVNKMKSNYPFDLLVNDKIKIDVKMCRPVVVNGTTWHTVGINKKYATCDLYIIFSLDCYDKIERIFIIPAFKVTSISLNFGKQSIYNKYINRWDYIDYYDNALEKIVNK